MLAERTLKFQAYIGSNVARGCAVLKDAAGRQMKMGSVEGVCSCLPKSQNLKHSSGGWQPTKRDLIYKDKEKAACSRTRPGIEGH